MKEEWLLALVLSTRPYSFNATLRQSNRRYMIHGQECNRNKTDIQEG